MFNTFSVSTDADNIARLSLGRADRFHAIDAEMIAELTDFFDNIAGTSIRAIIVEADGPHFCAGADLNWMQAQQQKDRQGKIDEACLLADMLSVINHCPCPVIARVQGNAFGGGVGLISVCDIAICVSDAKFALTEVRLGLIAATISPFVVGKIGHTGARQTMLSGKPFDADTALRLGLVSKICQPDMLDNAIEAEISAILKAGPDAVAASKALIHTLARTSSDQHREISVNALADCWEREETKQGISAFFAKTPAPWVPKN